MFRYILCLCLTIWATNASEMIKETVRFRVDNSNYLEKTIHTSAHDVIFIPRQGYADRTVVIHDYNKELSAYKDLTVGKCFITPFYRDVLNFKAVLFHFDKQGKKLPGRVIEMTPQRVIPDVQQFAGEDIADLCENFPAFWTVKTQSSSKRFRRGAHVSACGSVSVGKGGVSVSGSASAGSSSSSASAGSDSGGGFSCSGCGSVGVGRGGVSASGSAAASNGKTSANSGSNSGGSSSGSSGSGGSGWKRRR